MSSDTLAQIFVAIVAALPAILSVFSTYVKPYNSSPIDHAGHSFARILRIHRTPLDKKEWLLLRKQYVVDIITPLTVLIVIASLTLFLVAAQHLNLPLSITFFLVAAMYLIPFAYSVLRYVNLGNDSYESRHLIFKQAVIEIQTDDESLFDHIQVVLGYLNVRASEVDFDTKSFSVYVGSKIIYQKLAIAVQSQEEQKQFLSVSFESKLQRNYFLRPSFEVGSDIMNQFINLIVFVGKQ